MHKIQVFRHFPINSDARAVKAEDTAECLHPGDAYGDPILHYIPVFPEQIPGSFPNKALFGGQSCH